MISGPGSAIIFSTFYGVLIGSRQSLMIPMFADLFGTKHLGKVTAIATSVGLFSCGIGPLMFGICRDSTNDYKIAILTCAILTAIFSSSLLWIKLPELTKSDTIKNEIPYD